MLHIYPILLYGAKTWSLLAKTVSKKNETLEMWLYRQITNNSWTVHIYNTSLLQKMQK